MKPRSPLIYFISLLILALALAACSGADAPAATEVPAVEEPTEPAPTDPPPTEAPTEEAMAMPAPEGTAVMDYVLETNPYTEWGTWPADEWNDFSVNLVSGAPHGNVVRIYVNETALNAADSFNGTLPHGSMIVKENYTGTDPDNPGTLDALTIMYKVDGFNPEANDWFWVKAKPDGAQIDAEGAVEGCIGCHSQEENHDYVLRYGFGEEPAVTTLDPTAGLPAPEGAALMAYVLDENPYMDWGTWPADQWNDFSVNLVSGAPHGNVVRIYVNDIALGAADSFDGQMPNGSIILKENYTGTDPDNPGTLDALTIMYKVEGFNPEANDWFWVKAKPDGEQIDAEGAVAGCIDCHSQEGNHDYILRYGFGEEPAVTSLSEEATGDGGGGDDAAGTMAEADIEATAVDLAFEPTGWTVTAGADATVAFSNEGNLEHAWAVVKQDADLGGSYSDEQADSLHFEGGPIGSGASTTFSFTAPEEAGSYLVICTVPGHYAAGMAGELTVEE